MRRPYLRLWTSDWRGDVRLQSCSIAARGLWIEMMCIMHEAEPYGHLTVGSRVIKEGDCAFIALQVRSNDRDVKKALAELKEAGVYSVEVDGAIVCRRMMRDEADRLAEVSRKSGGNPVEKTRKSGGKNPEVERKSAGNPPDHPSRTISISNSRDINKKDVGAETDPLIDFCRWFVRTGVEVGAVGAHLDFELELQREIERSQIDAQALLDAYGRAECETRAERFLHALKAGKQRGYAWIKTLSERWTWPEIAGIDPPQKVERGSLRALPEPRRIGTVRPD